MWRIALFISLICSVVLNVYLFMQLNIKTIEQKIPQGVSLYPHQGAAYITGSTAKIKGMSKVKNIDQNNAIESTKSTQEISNKIKRAVTEKDYFNASFLISALANNYKTELFDVKHFWLNTTKALIQQKLFTDAEDSIDAYLAFNSDDGDFLYQQVDLYWQQHLLLLAIKHAYEIQYHLLSEAEKRDAINFSRALVQQQVDVLINNSLWLELTEFIEEVLLLDTHNPNLQLIYAQAHYQLGEFEYARNAIEPLLSQPNYKIKAQALLVDIEAALRKPQSIPLNRQGEHFIVQALINDTVRLSLMIDTGASISLLSESAFDTLNRNSNATYVKELTFNTAGGQVTSSIYQVDEFSIQGYTVNNFVFSVNPYVNERYDGLLGMNFLKNFDFHIDQNNNVLLLKNK